MLASKSTIEDIAKSISSRLNTPGKSALSYK
jgi:hypothetical protein